MIKSNIIQLFDNSNLIYRDSKNIITKIENDKYIVARTLNTKYALIELLPMFNTDSQIRSFLNKHDDLKDLRELYNYTFGI